MFKAIKSFPETRLRRLRTDDWSRGMVRQNNLTVNDLVYPIFVTEEQDGTKIESIENRLLIFDASRMHNSTTTTSFEGRYNINVNYF